MVDGGVGNNQLSGGNGKDVVRAGDGNNVLDGGNDDDTLIAGHGSNSLIGGNGNDTLTVGNGSNTIEAGNGNDRITVGTGNNSLSGGNGNDTFVFKPGFGDNVITDFRNDDHVEFNGVFAKFQDVQAAMHQVGADTVISLGANHSITLQHVTASNLHASDFLLL
jgi:Ca2+-binding RTX toxin-like protein